MQEAETAVNGHFLQHLVLLAATEEVNATEDVYSSSGIKLIGKGARLSEGMYERIVSHKLKKPLESSILVGAPIRPRQILEAAEALLDASPALARLVTYRGSRDDMLSLLKRINYGEQLGSLLKLYQSRMPNAISHATLVAMLATGILKRLGLNHAATLDVMLIASICHDIGDLYIDPALYAERSVPLTPLEWRQMAAHPVIGHTALKGVGGIAPVVADLVLEHHERLDGGGYPRGLGGPKVSREGHVLAVAEALSQFIGRNGEPFSYAEIALKILPGEFSTEVIDVIAACREELQVARMATHDAAPAPQRDIQAFQGNMNVLFLKIGRVCEVMDCLSEKIGHFPEHARQLHAEVCHRFERISRAISSAGLDIVHSGVACCDAVDQELAQIHLEFDATLSEVGWRLHELSRRIILKSAALDSEVAEEFARLAAAFSGAGANESPA